MVLSRKNYDYLGEPAGPYVHQVKHRDTLYLSGFTAFGTSAQKQGVAEQAQEIFRQLEYVAQQEGVTLKNLIKVTLFVTSFDDIHALRDALFDIYGSDLPASSMIKINGLFSDDLKIEVESIFAL